MIYNMVDRFINSSIFGLDNFLSKNRWLDFFDINDYTFFGIIWNLMLLAVPYYLLIILERKYSSGKIKDWRGRISGFAIFFAWLFFLPNTAYIITDLRHASSACALYSDYRVCPQTAWLIPFFFTYASIGWVSFVYFTRRMKDLVVKIHGEKIGEIFILLVIPLTSLGVLLGLLNRFNSWEVLTSPMLIIKNSSVYFSDPVYFFDWFVFTSALYILYWAGNKIFIKK